MASEFHKFPCLPKELRLMIWGFAFDDCQQRHLCQRQFLWPPKFRARFLTIYHTGKDAGLVPNEEKLLDQNDESFQGYALAAPRYEGGYNEAFWAEHEELAREMAWNACEESRSFARSKLKAITHDETRGARQVTWATYVSPFGKKDPDTWTAKVVDQGIARFMRGGEELAVPISANDDLLVLQPINMSNIDYDSAYNAIFQFGSRNIALEFDPLWGYPEGINMLNYMQPPISRSWLEVAERRPTSDLSRREMKTWPDLSDLSWPSKGPLRFVMDLAHHALSDKAHHVLPDDGHRTLAHLKAIDTNRLWFIGYRIHVCPDADMIGRTVFQDSMFRYVSVECVRIGYCKYRCERCFGLCTAEDEVNIFNFVEKLRILASSAGWSSGSDSPIGVLALVPLEDPSDTDPEY